MTASVRKFQPTFEHVCISCGQFPCAVAGQTRLYVSVLARGLNGKSVRVSTRWLCATRCEIRVRKARAAHLLRLLIGSFPCPRMLNCRSRARKSKTLSSYALNKPYRRMVECRCGVITVTEESGDNNSKKNIKNVGSITGRATQPRSGKRVSRWKSDGRARLTNTNRLIYIVTPLSRNQERRISRKAFLCTHATNSRLSINLIL